MFALAAVVLLTADPELDARFQARVSEQASAEGLWVLEWGLANLDDDGRLERFAKLCTTAPSREVVYVFQDDAAPAAEVWSWEVDEGGREQAAACPPAPAAPARWLVAAKELKHVERSGTGVRSSRSGLAWSVSVDVGFRKGVLVQVGGKTLGTPPEPAAAPMIHRVSTLGKLHAMLDAETWIHHLVPSDGKMNMVASDTLAELGAGHPEIGDAIVRHVFTAPDAFFTDATAPKERWLPGTQGLAAAVLCRLRHVKARPLLQRLHDDPATPAHLKLSLAHALDCFERP